jgi:hypothetical protein
MIGKPTVRRRNIPSAGLLNMDEHGIKGGVGTEPSNELEQLVIRCAGLVTSREGEQLVQGLPGGIPSTPAKTLHDIDHA